MRWWGWALLALLVLFAVTVVVMWKVVRALSRSVAEMGTALNDLRVQTMPLLADTRSALRKAEGQNRRADALIDTATSITGTVDAATKLAYTVVSNPLVRALSFFTGTRRAVARLRQVTGPEGRIARRSAQAAQAVQVTAAARRTGRPLEVQATATELPPGAPAQPVEARRLRRRR